MRRRWQMATARGVVALLGMASLRGGEAQAQVVSGTASGEALSDHDRSEAGLSPDAAAETLFQAGRLEMDSGEFARACAKFRKSQELDPSPGTLLNLARCEERRQHLATAWGYYLAAARLARIQNRQVIVDEALARSLALEPLLSYVAFQTEDAAPQMSIQVGNAKLDEAALATALPIDEGEHVIVVEAPGRQSRRLRFVVARASRVRVRIPPLVPLEKTFAETERSMSPAPPTRILPSVLIGTGALLATGGVATGIGAKVRYDEAQAVCPNRVDCGEAALRARDQAGVLADISTVLLPLGVGVAVTGFVLWFLDTPVEASARRGVEVLPGLASLEIRGVF